MLLLLLLLLPAPVNVLSDVNGATMQLHTITRLTVVTNSVGCRPFLAPQKPLCQNSGSGNGIRFSG
jgi:hypothetical protein